MKIHQYLEDLGFNKKESEIFLCVYKLGSQPASTIAKFCGLERTYTYKALLHFCEQNLMSVTEKGKIKHFFIPDISLLKKYVIKKRESYAKLEQDFFAVETELSQFNKKFSASLPKITLFDGSDGIKNMYDDILRSLEKKEYISVKLFASNLLEARGQENQEVRKVTRDFYHVLQTKGISVDALAGSGISVMESLMDICDFSQISDFPLSGSAVQIFVTGNVVYISIFKEIPVAIKIDSHELANCLFFMLEKMKVER